MINELLLAIITTAAVIVYVELRIRQIKKGIWATFLGSKFIEEADYPYDLDAWLEVSPKTHKAIECWLDGDKAAEEQAFAWAMGADEIFPSIQVAVSEDSSVFEDTDDDRDE
jgi:hypothetical protein